MNETATLARYAANLRYEDIPPEVLERARNTICDTVGATIFGYWLPWSQMIVDYAKTYGPGGRSRILGPGGGLAQPPMAAFANGACAHAFELDGSTKPSVGVHPCATIFPAALAVAQERGFGGRELITAFVAATEVVLRIGSATKHSNEIRGFHAPGTTGPFGAAIAAGRFLKLDAPAMTNALGIAGSLCGGLLEFARGDGGMVKRLHLGRASEAGVLAASLAAGGFTGPRTVLEGEFGFLKVFCTKWDEGELTRGIGEEFVVSSTVLKRYPCHATAHAAVKAVRELQAEHGFTGAEVEAITITGNQRMVERHNILEPGDLMLAQYSIPFCVALALHREARDPESYDQTALADPQIRALCRRVRLVPEPHGEHGGTAGMVTITLADGRRFERRAENGMLEPGELPDKFLRLTRAALGEHGAATLYERLQQLEGEQSLDWLR